MGDTSHPPPRDRAWFEDLFRRHHAAVIAFARRRVDDPDDVVSEVFATAWRRRADVPDEPLPWLYRTAAHEVLHHRRGLARRRRLIGAIAREPDAGGHAGGPAAPAPGEYVEGVVLAALGRLSEPDQELLRLWAWEELDVTGIAYVVGCRVGTARVRLHRARERLRRALPADLAPTPAPSPPVSPAFTRGEP